MLLLVEVAESSLADDGGTKLPLYARYGIAAVWIVDLAGRVIEVHAAPTGGRFAAEHRHEAGSSAPACLPECAVDLGRMFA